MRRSLGNGGGKGMGGGTFHRAIRADVGGAPPSTTTPFGGAKKGKAKNFNKKQPTTTPNSALTLNSSSSSAPFSLSTSYAPVWISSSSSSSICSDESEWEYVVDGIEDGTAVRDLYDDYVFGTAPSNDEVHYAVSALQKALASSSHVTSSKTKLAEITHKDVAVNATQYFNEKTDSEIDLLEPSPSSSAKMLQNPRSDIVYDAFHLLETEPSVQRMVVSLTSDKAIWDAVLNNDVVKEPRGSIDRVTSLVKERSAKISDDPSGYKNILSSVVLFVKGKMTQLLDLITKLTNNVFAAPNQDKEGEGDGFDKRVRCSLFLSFILLFVIIIARTKNQNA